MIPMLAALATAVGALGVDSGRGGGGGGRNRRDLVTGNFQTMAQKLKVAIHARMERDPGLVALPFDHPAWERLTHDSAVDAFVDTFDAHNKSAPSRVLRLTDGSYLVLGSRTVFEAGTAHRGRTVVESQHRGRPPGWLPEAAKSNGTSSSEVVYISPPIATPPYDLDVWHRARLQLLKKGYKESYDLGNRLDGGESIQQAMRGIYRDRREIPEVVQKTLQHLRKQLDVRDIGVDLKNRTLFVMSGLRKLQGRAQGSDIWVLRLMDPELRYHNVYSWDDWEYAVYSAANAVLKRFDPDLRGPSGDSYFSDFTVLPVPAPGGPQMPWWSVAKNKWMEPVYVKPFDYCTAAPRVDLGHLDGPFVFRLLEDKGDARLGAGTDPDLRPFPLPFGDDVTDTARDVFPPLFLYHAVPLAKMRDIEACGGLLYPSCNLSWRVGPYDAKGLILLADVRAIGTLLKGGSESATTKGRGLVLKPDRGSEMRSGRRLDRHAKARTWELKGDRGWWSNASYEDAASATRATNKGGWGLRGLQQRLVNQGMTLDEMMGHEDYKREPIVRRSQLVDRLRELMYAYTGYSSDGSSPQQYNASAHHLYDATDNHHHGEFTGFDEDYLELTAFGKVDLSSFPAVVYPSRYRRGVETFLDRMGYTGIRIRVPFQGPVADDYSGKTYAYADAEAKVAWGAAATEYILRTAFNGARGDLCKLPGVRVGSALKISHAPRWNRRYNPVMSWAKNYTFRSSGDGHLGWIRGYIGPGECRFVEEET